MMASPFCVYCNSTLPDHEPGCRGDTIKQIRQTEVTKCAFCKVNYPLHHPECMATRSQQEINDALIQLMKASVDMPENKPESKSSPQEKAIGIVGAACLSIIMIAFTIWAAAWFIGAAF